MPDLSLPLGLADLQREMARGKVLPPVERWNPPFCGDSFMRILKDGTWLHHGTPIGRKELVRLFSTILRKEGEDYFLVTPAEKLSIAIDDAPFLAVLLAATGEGADQLLSFTTNVGDEVKADNAHPISVRIDPASGEPSPHIHVRNGLNARINRAVYYELVQRAVAGAGAHENYLGVWSGGEFFRLGPQP
jgi:hypothetical protein